MKVKGKGKSLRAELSAYRLQACAANCLQSLRASMKFPNKRMKLMKALLRMWRLLVIRGPPSDSDGERPRPINGQLVSPQHLWKVGCRIYMTAVPDIFRAWLAKAYRANTCGDAPRDHFDPPADGVKCMCLCGCRRRWRLQ